LYAGFRFFAGHKLKPGLDPGEVRLALDIISLLRPSEILSREESDLLAKLDPRASRRRPGGRARRRQ
jgi:hypothetical protein